MWLLIVAVPLLLISSIISAYLAESYQKPDYERPLVLIEHGTKLVLIDILCFIAGVVLSVLLFGWLGLISVAIYWLFIVSVLMPIGMQRILLLLMRKK